MNGAGHRANPCRRTTTSFLLLFCRLFAAMKLSNPIVRHGGTDRGTQTRSRRPTWMQASEENKENPERKKNIGNDAFSDVKHDHTKHSTTRSS